MSENHVGRRSFLKNLALGVAALPAFGLLRGWSAQASSLPAGKAECKTSDPVAQAVGYETVASDKKKPCKDCMFYGSLNADFGTCQIIPNCVVPAKGSCKSFAKKA